MSVKVIDTVDISYSMTQRSTHEYLQSKEPAAPGSERSFAIVMAVALTLLGTINWWRSGRVWPWFDGIAVLVIVIGYLVPTALKPLNWLWFKLGLVLHALINPIVMALLFYGVVLPTGLVLRVMGKDPLRLRDTPERNSYWIIRQPPGPAPETMKDQF